MSEWTYSDLTLLRRLLIQARPYWGHLTAVFLLGLAATPLALLTPVPLKVVVDSVLGGESLPGFLDAVVPEAVATSPFRLLVFAAAFQVLVVLLLQLREMGEYVLGTYTGERLTLGFRAALFRHIQRLPFTFHDSRGTSDSIYRIQYDTPAVQNLLVYGLIPLASSLLMVGAMVAVTFSINWQLAAVALTVAPILFMLSRTYKVRMRGRYTTMKELESSALDVVQEVLGALRVVKAFGREESEQDRFVRRSQEGVRAKIKISFAEGLFGLSLNMAAALGTAAVLFMGVLQIQAGNMTLGELLVVIAYLGQLYGPMKTLSQKTGLLQSALASAQRAFELEDEPPEVLERPHARPLHRAIGAVAFEDVRFAYPDGTEVLRGASFEVAPGTRIGVAGRTGAGKTTLVSLITRFYDPTAGRILLDGTDLRDLRIADLRNQFAIVLQEPVLFSTSIAENIAYARPSATQEEIVAAAAAAEAHDFILALPDGYDTEVGERGLRLSGGERQRISLARAFLKDAPLLILDEPTSAVDVRTEAGIMTAMTRLMRDRTTFMIAHRLSTLEHCDVVLVLESGHLIVTEPDAAMITREAFAPAPGLLDPHLSPAS